METEGRPDESKEQEKTEPTPEEVGKAIRKIFTEVITEIPENRQNILKQELADQGIFIGPAGQAERKEAEVFKPEGEIIEYDLSKNLADLLDQVVDNFVKDITSGQKDVFEIMGDTYTIIEGLGREGEIVFEKFAEMGVTE